jgi:hypothetical protein
MIFLIRPLIYACPPCGNLPSDFPIKTLYAFLISSVRASYPTLLTLLDVITLKILCECFFNTFIQYVSYIKLDDNLTGGHVRERRYFHCLLQDVSRAPNGRYNKEVLMLAVTRLAEM